MTANPFAKFADALQTPATAGKSALPVFIGGIKYPSLFDAGLDSGINSVSIWKALKKQAGGPVQIRKTLVVLERWVTSRANRARGYYQL